MRRSSLLFLLGVLALPNMAQAQDWGWKEGRADLARIARGDTERAIIRLLKRLEKETSLFEIHFLLAVAYATQGELDRALSAAERAVELGLPPERLFAGPRSLLAPLRPAIERRFGKTSQLIHGPLLGSITDSGARVWVRTRDETLVSVQARRLDAKSPATSTGRTVAAQRTSAARDFTARLELTDLASDATYVYTVDIAGETVAGPFRFRTFPKRGSKSSFSVAFGGGAAFTPIHERVFSTIREHQPITFLQLGDNVYIDEPKLPAVQEYCYYRRLSSLPYRELSAETNIAAIWD
ncbi:MAG: hypothetical protein AAF517_17700, partial [Planctomycetota bacterium]